MGIMVVMMVAFLALVPSHMGLGGHQHGQGNPASQPAEPRTTQDAGAPAGIEQSGHSH